MLSEIVESFPSFGFFSPNDERKTKEALTLADMDVSPLQFLSFSLSASVLFAFMAFLLMLLFFQPELALAFALLSFSSSYLLLLHAPKIVASRRARAMETDLPVVLRTFAVELNTGVSFERCLEHASDSPYAISFELRRMLNEMKGGGASLPDALMRMSLRVDSLIVKRTAQQIIGAYKQGSGGEAFKHLANELIDQQKAASREYNARIAFLGLIFVVASCIVPALFQAYAIVGSSFLYTSFSASDIWLIYVFLFPAADLLVLLAIYERTPKLVSKRREAPLSKRQLLLADRALQSIGIGFGLKAILLYAAAASIACSAIAYALASAFHFNTVFSVLPLAFPVVAYFMAVRFSEQRTSSIEQRLPDAMLHASSFPRGTPIEGIVKSIADADYGPLSEEFSKARRQVSSGADVPAALRAMSEENDSVLLARACDLLSRAYESGGDMHKALKETAEDMFSMFSIVRERESMLALQKYTLLFGGALIVPLVLGSIGGALSNLDVTGIELLSTITAEERLHLMSASTQAVQAYLVAYSLMASLFIAQLSGSWRSFAPYFIFMAALSALTYNLALNTNLFSAF